MAINPTDSPNDYYNFKTPNYLVTSGKYQPVVHRLGSFPTVGVGNRKYNPGIPKVIVLHVPVADYFKQGTMDYTAENVALYLANPPENNPSSKYYRPGVKKVGYVHLTADRDSYVVCWPFDSVAWGCGNPNTYEASLEIEIGGMGTETPDYWRGADAALKFKQTAKGIIKGYQLAFGNDWKLYLPPFQIAELSNNGSVLKQGFTQHRDVPYYDYKKNVWAQPPKDNILAGQHADICEGFPFDSFFKVLAQEINAVS